MEGTKDMTWDKNFDTLEGNMEAGFLSSAILERHSGGHGLAMPSWTVIPVLYHAPRHYDVAGISKAISDEDSAENGKCTMKDKYGMIWEIDADKVAEHERAMRDVRSLSLCGLSLMRSLKYFEAVRGFDAALSKLWPCHRDSLLELWINVHRGHALLRAGLLLCPAVHDQDTKVLLEASRETFQHCQDILTTKLNKLQAFNRSLLFSTLLGLAWCYFFRGETKIAENYIRNASDIQLPKEDMRSDRDLDTIFFQVALHRVDGNLQGMKKSLDTFGNKLSNFDEDIFLVSLLDREIIALTGSFESSVFFAMRSALYPGDKFIARHPQPNVTKFLEQLEAGYFGNMWLAVGACKQAKVAYEIAYSSDSLLLQATALVGLGNVLMTDYFANPKASATDNQSQPEFGEAEKKYKEALQIYNELGLKEAQIIVRCNLGKLYHKRGQLEQALEQYQKAMTYFTAGMDTSSAALYLHLTFAELHLDTGNWIEALDSIQKADKIPTTSNKLGEAWLHHLYGTYYHKRSTAAKSRDEQLTHLSKAENHFLNAMKCFAEIHLAFRLNFRSVSTTMFEQQKETYVLHLWCLACQEEASVIQALVWCERSRSRVLMVERWESFADPLREYLSDGAVFKALFATASQEFDNLPWEESWKNLQMLLRRCTLSKGTVLVEYVLCAEFGYMIFVLDMPAGQPKMKRISFDEHKLNGNKLDRGKLNELVNDTNRMISQLDTKSGKLEEVETNLAALYKILIEPVEGWLKNSKHIILIPHEILFKVPFHALIDGNKEYLIEKYTLSCVESIRHLVRCWFLWEERVHSRRQQDDHTSFITSKTKKWLVVGINNHKPFASNLKKAEEEATEIAGMEFTSGVTIQRLLGSQATKEQIMSCWADADVIHLATHGIINPKYERGGILFVAPADLQNVDSATDIIDVERAYTDTESAEVTTRSLDDLRLSAKWWNENKSSAEKLVLSAIEISNMNLKARLVVLSACQSAEGVILGEGVAGLGRALLTAGVPSTVLSLWPVSDRTTVDFMKEFYTELARGQSVADAMRIAMVTMLNAKQILSDKPKYTVREWAAFWSFGLPTVRLQGQELPTAPSPQAPSPPRSQLVEKLLSPLRAPGSMAIAAATVATTLAMVFSGQVQRRK